MNTTQTNFGYKADNVPVAVARIMRWIAAIAILLVVSCEKEDDVNWDEIHDNSTLKISKINSINTMITDQGGKAEVPPTGKVIVKLADTDRASLPRREFLVDDEAFVDGRFKIDALPYLVHTADNLNLYYIFSNEPELRRSDNVTDNGFSFGEFEVWNEDGVKLGSFDYAHPVETPIFTGIPLYAHRDVIMTGRISGNRIVRLSLKRGWNMTYWESERDKNGNRRTVSITTNEPEGMAWVFISK